MPFPLAAIGAAAAGLFTTGAVLELGRQATRKVTKIFSREKNPSRIPTPPIVVEVPNTSAELTKSQSAYYNQMARLKSEEIAMRKDYERARMEIDSAIAAANEKIKREELKIKKQELEVKHEELAIKKKDLSLRMEVAGIEQADRQKLFKLKERELEITQNWQQLQVEMAEIEREFRAEQNQSYWDVLRDLKKQELEVKIAEIQSKWDSIEKNWPSTLSRIDTEKILGKVERNTGAIPLLVLAARPNFLENKSSLSINRFQNQFKFRLKKSMESFPVDYLDGFFNRKIEDADIKLLESIIHVRPTIVLHCDVDEESLYFHAVAWGWPESDSCSFCEEIRLDSSLTHKDSFSKEEFQQLAEKIISAYEFVSMSLVDWYYANYDLGYKPQLPSILSEYSKEEQTLLEGYIKPLETIGHLNAAQVHYIDGLNFSKLGHYGQAIDSFEEAKRTWADFPGADMQISIQEQLISNWENSQTIKVQSSTNAACSYSLDGQALAIVKDYNIEIWRVEEGKLVYSDVIECDTDSFIDNVAISHSKKLIAVSRDDRTIHTYDARTGKPYSSMKGHASLITSLQFSSDDRKIASASKDKSVMLWDVESGEEVVCLEGHRGPIHSIVFNPTEPFLMTGSDDKTIKVWCTEKWDEIRELSGHSNWIRDVAIGSDGYILASASYDNTIKLWQAKSGEEISTLTGHDGRVLSLAFTQDSNVLLSGGSDCDIKVWHTETGKLLKTIKGHKEPVSFISASKDGQYFVSSSSDNCIKVWTLVRSN